MKLQILFFITLFFYQFAFAQSFTLEKNIQKADSLWKSNHLNQAIEQYKVIIKQDSVPEEYQSLIYLRLAKAQFQAKQVKECRATLLQAKTLPVVPDHHRLIIEELEKRLDGVSANENTPVPADLIPAVKLYVTSSTHAVSKSGSNKIVYKTLKQALEAIPTILKKAGLLKGPIEIILEKETFDLNETIQLHAENSGTKDNPVVIRSASESKQVIINGGMALKIWKRETNPQVLVRLPKGSRSKVWVADFKENNVTGIDSLVFGGFSSKRAAGTSATFNSFPVPELFSNGTPQQMARWPNDRDTIVSLKDFRSERALGWAADPDVWLHGYWLYLWADAYEKMGGISPRDSTIQLQPPYNNYGFGKSKWHVVNALSELDSPGEWCISIAQGKIWYIPSVSVKPEYMILSMKGPALTAENCNYLTIKGIDLQFIRGDGMIFTNCSHLTLAKCSVSNTSGLGFKIAGGRNHLVHSCTIRSMGRGGIDIDSGDKLKLTGSGSIIENCKISNLSRIDRTYTPAIVLAGDGIKVRNCLFANIPSSGIRLEGNDMLVELNEFTKCVIESDDQGAIDVWGNPLYRGNIIRWNFFHDIGIPNLHMAAGVRLDDAISGFCIFENLFLRSSNNQFGGIQIHGGKDNFIEGNIFTDCHAAISQSAWGDKRWQESIIDKDHPMYKALQTTDWQSESWQKRYPALKTLTTNPDINYAIDNVAINVETFILRKSKQFEILNNKLLKSENHPAVADDYMPYKVPWQNIPFEKIGPYK